MDYPIIENLLLGNQTRGLNYTLGKKTVKNQKLYGN